MRADRLREAMTGEGLSQAELARRAGTSPATIQQLLNGSIKTTKSLRAIANALKVSSDWLEGISEVPITDLKLVAEPGDRDTVVIPYLGVFYPTDMAGSLVGVRRFEVSRYWFEDTIGNYKATEYTLAQIKTPEMAPTINRGDDVCYIHLREHDGSPDGIWWLDYRNVQILRRVRPLSEGTYLVTADNPSYAPFEADESQLAFGGKIVWQGRSLVR